MRKTWIGIALAAVLGLVLFGVIAGEKATAQKTDQPTVSANSAKACGLTSGGCCGDESISKETASASCPYCDSAAKKAEPSSSSSTQAEKTSKETSS